jgi:sirohydrochlorin ferrochelatase
LLALGWTQGQPWTAAAFVVFFSSRVGRSEVKRRLTRRRTDDAVRRTNQFILITAAGWLGAGALALVATMTGEGQEWMFVAPFFLVMGALNLYIALK